jgi:hypothetical protein
MNSDNIFGSTEIHHYQEDTLHNPLSKVRHHRTVTIAPVATVDSERSRWLHANRARTIQRATLMSSKALL